jgi:hypothetical protein
LLSFLLGKDMNWDTLDYHFYAGFSALHGRFGMDYFAAGSQSYFNPYVYVPFYLLASSRLPAFAVASILAIVQSGLLWLTYELALQAAPTEAGRSRIGIAICSALFAFADPITLNLFGSSYADMLTAELVLAGWLLLVAAVRVPSIGRVVAAGLLLGAASALKLTNSVHALSAGVLLLFVPLPWSGRVRHIAAFGASLVVCFLLVCLPWSLRLGQHFGNPLFPLLNGIFRSPQFPTARMLDYRFIPDSLADALWRPFAIAKPEFMVDDEQQAPDIRYAVLLVAAILLLSRWAWSRYRNGHSGSIPQSRRRAGGGVRSLVALGVAFTVDWMLWLTASGNGRYFIPMACIAGILAIVLVWQLFAIPRIRIYLLTLILGAQCLQLYLGTTYRVHIPWDGPWFDVRLPANFPRVPTLYLSFGVQSNAFVVPFLPPGSGFVNIGGDYPLGADGANGAAVAALIHEYWPRVRVLARDGRAPHERPPTISGMTAAADVLMAFALRPTGSGCSTIAVSGAGRQELMFVHTVGHSTPAKVIPDREVPASTMTYLNTCPVVPDPSALARLTGGKQQAEQALDDLEDSCPKLFQPRRPLMQPYVDAHQMIWARRYLNTNLTAWVSRGWVWFIDPLRGGGKQYIGAEADFGRKGARLLCGRSNELYYARLGAPPAPRSDP